MDVPVNGSCDAAWPEAIGSLARAPATSSWTADLIAAVIASAVRPWKDSGWEDEG